jgi:hypothetical protein
MHPPVYSLHPDSLDALVYNCLVRWPAHDPRKDSLFFLTFLSKLCCTAGRADRRRALRVAGAEAGRVADPADRVRTHHHRLPPGPLAALQYHCSACLNSTDTKPRAMKKRKRKANPGDNVARDGGETTDGDTSYRMQVQAFGLRRQTQALHPALSALMPICMVSPVQT